VLGRAGNAVDRGDIHDRSAALTDHLSGDLLSQEELSPDIDIEEQIEPFRLDIEKGFVQADPGIVHEALDAAKELSCAIAERDDLVQFAEVGLIHFASPSHCLYLVASGEGARLRVRIVKGYVGALAAEFECYLASEAGA
jgi:hypothetical protein